MVVNIHNQRARRPFFPGVIIERLPQGMAADISLDMAFQGSFFNNVISAVSGNRYKMVILVTEDILVFAYKWTMLPQKL